LTHEKLLTSTWLASKVNQDMALHGRMKNGFTVALPATNGNSSKALNKRGDVYVQYNESQLKLTCPEKGKVIPLLIENVSITLMDLQTRLRYAAILSNMIL